MLSRKRTAEEWAERDRAKEQKQADAERRRFLGTPAGKARAAFERGDRVFQYSLDVMNQEAIIVALVGSSTSQQTVDPGGVLNSVCDEGWDLVNGSFVFLEQGQQSRDKLLSSGQNVAIKGTTVGYYLFRRCEEHRVGSPPA